MRKLICQMALQADIDIRHIEKHAEDNFGEHLENFARMIMTECAEVCNDPTCGREYSSKELIEQFYGVTL